MDPYFSAPDRGLAGALVPLIPDTPLILAAAVLQHFLFAPHGVGWSTLIGLCVLMLCSLVLDLLSGSVGAKYFGATRWGAIGGIVGAARGLFFGLAGIFLGPLAGVLLGELLGGKGLLPAGRSAWGTRPRHARRHGGEGQTRLIMIAWFLIAALLAVRRPIKFVQPVPAALRLRLWIGRRSLGAACTGRREESPNTARQHAA